MADGTIIFTLSDARSWALEQPSTWQNQYQQLAKTLFDAANGGNMAAARDALVNAAVLGMGLDFKRP
jgi:hypothetical protein